MFRRPSWANRALSLGGRAEHVMRARRGLRKNRSGNTMGLETHTTRVCPRGSVGQPAASTRLD